MSQPLEFHDHIFFHTDPRGTILWNAKLRDGWAFSISALLHLPEMEGAASPYGALAKGNRKEDLWESVRAAEFPDKPSRINALFLFTSRGDAEIALQTWFKGQVRDIIHMLVPKSEKLHIADSRYLDATEADWEAAARSYWNGDRTSDPFLEAVLQGAALIPNCHALVSRHQ